MATNKERLIGSRLGDLIRNGASKIPNNGATRAIGNVANRLINNKNPFANLYNNAEAGLINKGGDALTKYLKIDPTIGRMGIGFAIPGGPGNDVKTVKNAANFNKLSKTLKGSTPLWQRLSTNKPFRKLHGESWEEAIKFMEGGYEHFGKKGNLANMPSTRYWTNPSTNTTYRLKGTVSANKINPANMTGISLKTEAAQQASAYKRARNTKVNENKVFEIVNKMGGTPDQADAYIKMNKLEKKALTEYIAKLNKKLGSTEVSLGHKAAAERFEHSADIANNLKIERFRTTEKGGLGNAARSNKAELTDDLNTALNGSFSLEEDIAKFLDPTVGAFWVGMSNSQKKQMMDLVNKGMDMDDALDKVGFGETVLGSSRDSMKIRRY